MIRQGDVALVRLGRKPNGFKNATKVARENGRVVLAHGEVTGHAHAIAEEAVELFELPEDRGRVLVVDELSVLAHEEHTALEIPPGVYRVIRQREYSPEAIRNVAD
jgi:hypothetical protein